MALAIHKTKTKPKKLRGASGLLVLFQRGQIDKASFLAACDYEALLEQAEQKALACLESRIANLYGHEGVKILREVIGDGSTIEAVARKRGERTKAQIHWFGGYFRRVLRCVAKVLGHAP